MTDEIERDDIVAELNESGDVILESIGIVSDVYPKSSAIEKTVKVYYYSTSALYRNWWGVYYAHKLKKLTTKEVFYFLRAREGMRRYKTFDEVL
jgi:hypothetical protein